LSIACIDPKKNASPMIINLIRASLSMRCSLWQQNRSAIKHRKKCSMIFVPYPSCYMAQLGGTRSGESNQRVLKGERGARRLGISEGVCGGDLGVRVFPRMRGIGRLGVWASGGTSEGGWWPAAPGHHLRKHKTIGKRHGGGQRAGRGEGGGRRARSVEDPPRWRVRPTHPPPAHTHGRI